MNHARYKFAFTLHGECEYAKEQHFVDMTLLLFLFLLLMLYYH